MMAGPGKAPVRTEADISAALTELAQRAPSAAAVLSAMRDVSAHQQDGMPRTLGGRGTRRLVALAPRLRWPQLALAGAAATTAIVLAVVLIPGGAPVQTHGSVVFPPIGALPSEPGPVSPGSVLPVVSPGRHPSAASVAKAMLAAFSAAADDLAFQTSADFLKGSPDGTTRMWNWPATPIPGKLEYTLSSYRPPEVGKEKGRVTLSEDVSYTTVVPPPSRYGQNAYARVILVCHAGACGYNNHSVRPGTWWTRTGMFGYVDFTPDPSGAEFARELAQGDWRILGHTQLRGQRAIKLVETRTGHFMPRPVFLWVSTATYLPLRMVWLSHSKTGEVDNWYYLRPTKANLAQLRTPIPAGYRRSG